MKLIKIFAIVFLICSIHIGSFAFSGDLLSKSYINIGSEGGTESVLVNSNDFPLVTENYDWVHWSVAPGQGGIQINFEIDRNTSSLRRIASI